MNLRSAIEKVLTGNCILFTGSGYGFGAKNIQNKNMLLGAGFAKLLYDKLQITDHDNDLKTAAEVFIEEYGTHELITLIKQEFTVKTISEQHKLLGTLPWKRVYTTNYDNILEKSFQEAGKLLTPISLIENINEYKDFRKLCVHLNGYIDNLMPSILNKEFKLTNSSYLTAEFINSQWVDLFRSDLHTCDAIIFIGFSMSSDLDISRIIAENIDEMKSKCFFIVSPTETALNIRKFNKFGQPLPIGLDAFAAQIRDIAESFIPPRVNEYSFKSFTEVCKSESIAHLKDIDFHNLMLLGNAKLELIQQSIVNPTKYPYFIFRNQTREVFEKIDEGVIDFVIHSSLGNGKTLFLKGVESFGLSKGYKVYEFYRYFDLTNSEIERICNSKDKTIVIIENYSNHFDLIEKFNLFRKSNVVLLLSERTIINDTLYYTLEEIIGEKYYTINLDRLDYNETANFAETLSNYGLWGKFSNLSVESKRRKILDEFRSSFRLTLLDIMRSTDIQVRLEKLITPLRQNKSFFEASLLIIASNLLGFEMSLDELTYLLDDDLLNNPTFYNNSGLKEIIDFKSRKISIKSSILAEGILHTNEYSHDLIPLLVKVVKKLDNSRFNKNNYIILKSIVSHSRLQKLFNTSERNDFRKLVIEFFEEIKNLNYSKRNPYFWLQYAMARLEIRDYKVADQFFNTAYSFAEKMDGFDTFQIDNHYARHLLENEIFNGDIDSCMSQFMKAHNILSDRSDHNNNRHYPFKVARNYLRFYDHYFSKLPTQDKKIFLISCKEILFRIDDYNAVVDPPARNRVVKQCFEEISSILLKEKTILT